MTNFDRTLPADPRELPKFLECETHAVFKQFEKSTGDTEFICCRYDKDNGCWDTPSLETYDETKAEAWFNPSDEEE
jgi:hypothetical protein